MNEWDIFISYTHIDNQHYPGIPQGWIDDLQERLEIRLAQLLGRTPHIWRDRKQLRGNIVFQDEINDDLAKVSVFVSVLSPRYLESDSCQAEVKAFTRIAKQQGGIRRGNTHRVFKVIKTEIPREAHPADWQGLLGYEFYEKDPITGRVREFDHLLIGNQRDKRYWDKLEDLADDIKEALLTVQTATTPQTRGLLDIQPQAPPEPARINVSSGITVYVAETTSDLTAERDTLKRELQQRGHHVVPDQTLPLTAPALEQAGREYLQQARLSVHLLGAHYGVVPEMERSRSNVHLQIDLAAGRCGQPNFARLLWIPPGLQPTDERQQYLIDTVQRTPLVGSELLQTKLEDLKNHVHTKLAPPPPLVTNDHQEQEAPKVYLIYDEQDYDEAKPLDDFLNDHGIIVLQPPLGNDDDTQSMQQYHTDNLKLCDAVLIFHGQAPPMWAQVKLQDLIKLPGLGRTQPLLAKALYLGAPPNNQKERLRTRDVLLIKGYQGFKAEMLESFLSRLKQGPHVGS
jgi:TIR domain